MRAAVGRWLSGEMAGVREGGELTGREPSPRLQCAGMVYEHLAYTGDSGSRNAKSEMSRNKAKEDCRMSPSSREPPTLPSADLR